MQLCGRSIIVIQMKYLKETLQLLKKLYNVNKIRSIHVFKKKTLECNLKWHPHHGIHSTPPPPPLHKCMTALSDKLNFALDQVSIFTRISNSCNQL